MTSYFSPALAELGRPLFDSQWLALFVILGSVTAFLLAIAAIGRWLAATHPDEPAKPAEPVASDIPAAASSEVTAEVFAVIAAAVAVTLGAKARVTAINLSSAELGAESSIQQWSLEGRRQIYSSHKVR